MTTTQTRIPGATFVGRAPGGACERCSRELAAAYIIEVPGGGRMTLGRRCASRALGWATTRVEMAAVQAERFAELERRRALLAANGFPVYGDTHPFDAGVEVLEDCTDDRQWRDGDAAALDAALEFWAWVAHWAEQGC